VRETGRLPGIALQAAYTAGTLTWRGGADCYRCDIGYAGRAQAGVPAGSTTSHCPPRSRPTAGGATSPPPRAPRDCRKATVPPGCSRPPFDRARTPRSRAVPLTADGQYRGTITRPEHTWQALTSSVAAMY